MPWASVVPDHCRYAKVRWLRRRGPFHGQARKLVTNLLAAYGQCRTRAASCGPQLQVAARNFKLLKSSGQNSLNFGTSPHCRFDPVDNVLLAPAPGHVFEEEKVTSTSLSYL